MEVADRVGDIVDVQALVLDLLLHGHVGVLDFRGARRHQSARLHGASIPAWGRFFFGGIYNQAVDGNIDERRFHGAHCDDLSERDFRQLPENIGADKASVESQSCVYPSGLRLLTHSQAYTERPVSADRAYRIHPEGHARAGRLDPMTGG